MDKILENVDPDSLDQLVGLTFDNYNSRLHEPLGDYETKFTVKSIDSQSGTIEVKWHVLNGTHKDEIESFPLGLESTEKLFEDVSRLD
jgi:hypothetical protein